ncbi:hypothetical protein FPF71_16835 [Algibacter amylolyticus]|uniref:Uncharacterized protein n=2 Tax=Algibacter amylolyticus TaxID=1608400 RepID=A0A5M7AUR3_9FLAO|nr:hypothetical protein [Algibacter amylolyticus]KAA5821203.1 hypothetical protein F2B50_16835 [Algibacter amylolyticus]TSJ72149.1 hypothetical protein FPF71_16835 [Algibacter amylolyticus]
MNLEEDNIEKRKHAPLSNSEAASFFFIPIGFAKISKWENTDFNVSEMARFKKFGFERKIKQASEMRLYGMIFYISITILLTYFLG